VLVDLKLLGGEKGTNNVIDGRRDKQSTTVFSISPSPKKTGLTGLHRETVSVDHF